MSGIVLCNTTGLNVTENVLYRITGSMFSIEVLRCSLSLSLSLSPHTETNTLSSLSFFVWVGGGVCVFVSASA
jgi:hypothetical protein